MRALRSLGGALGASLLVACSAADDVVFIPLTIGHPKTLLISEASGLVSVELGLSAPPSRRVTADYEIRPVTAQHDCFEPDFAHATGTLVWPPGVTRAQVTVRVVDDELAETDETLRVELSNVQGAFASPSPEIQLTILDDERSALFDAADFGVEPADEDQAAPLQAALDAAAEAGRGVVSLAPGDYVVSSVVVAPGTTLSGYGARLVWPELAGAESKTIALSYTGEEDSTPTLIEGIAIDGRRDLQGEFRDYSQEDSALIAASASDEGGRARLTLQSLRLESAAGSGVALGSNVDVTACGINGYDIWHELIGATGGNSRVRVRSVTAEGSEGTTGLYFGARTAGAKDSRAMQVELEDALLGTGDLELPLGEGSQVTMRNVTMARAPFRLIAPGSKVTISDSLLMLGIPSERHNQFRVPHDVAISRSTLVLSEQMDELAVTEEADRTLWFVDVLLRRSPEDDLESGSHSLVFDDCRFELASDVEAEDEVYVLHSPEPGGSVVVRGGTLGRGVLGWSAPECEGCVVEP